MKTYYCVTTTFDNRGRVTANITDSIQAETKPKNTYMVKQQKDIYNDWFDDIKTANMFIEDTMMA